MQDWKVVWWWRIFISTIEILRKQIRRIKVLKIYIKEVYIRVTWIIQQNVVTVIRYTIFSIFKAFYFTFRTFTGIYIHFGIEKNKTCNILPLMKNNKKETFQDLSLTTILLQFRYAILFCRRCSRTCSHNDFLSFIVSSQKFSWIKIPVSFRFLAIRSIYCSSLNLLNLNMIVLGRFLLCLPIRWHLSISVGSLISSFSLISSSTFS